MKWGMQIAQFQMITILTPQKGWVGVGMWDQNTYHKEMQAYWKFPPGKKLLFLPQSSVFTWALF